MFKLTKLFNKQIIYSVIIILSIGITLTLIWGFNKTSLYNDKTPEHSNTSSSKYPTSSTNTPQSDNTTTPQSIKVQQARAINSSTSTPQSIEVQQPGAINSSTSTQDQASTTLTSAAIMSSSAIKASKAIFAGPKKMHVSLTFDDGYDRTAIMKVLDVFKEENIKGTFFVIGKNLNNNQDLWKRAVKEGHEVCNHTYYHQLLGKMSDEKIIEEFTEWEKVAEKVLGAEYVVRMKQDFPFIRLPGGEGNNNNRILSLAQSQGYKVIGWDTDSYTGVIRQMVKNKNSKDQIAKQVSVYIPKAAKKGSIILLHFNSYDTQYLKQTIKGLKDKGYDIKSISEIIKN